MIISFRHQGLETLYRTGNTRGVRSDHVAKLRRILVALDSAIAPAELGLPGFGLHPSKGSRKEFWSLWVNGNWRVIFRFVGADIELVDYQDYH